MSSPSMPSFNIFIMMPSPEKKDKKEKDKKENKLAEALKSRDDTMMAQMEKMTSKMPMTYHVGGG